MPDYEQYMKVTCNKAQCLVCGDVVESKGRHDFVWCTCKAMAVDGGKAYLKRCGEMGAIKEMSTEVKFTKEEMDDAIKCLKENVKYYPDSKYFPASLKNAEEVRKEWYGE